MGKQQPLVKLIINLCQPDSNGDWISSPKKEWQHKCLTNFCTAS